MFSADEVLRAYLHGYFPMADPSDGLVYWCRPHRRALFSLDSYRSSRSVRRLLRRGEFEVSVDREFRSVITACAAPRKDEGESWINQDIIDVYCELHEQGFAHSIACYRDGVLAGGLYGLAIGGGFFGESMFTRKSNASKVALQHLVDRLRAGGFILLDAQIMNPHLESLGAFEVSHERYMELLREALEKKNCFL